MNAFLWRANGCYHPVVGWWYIPYVKSMIPCGNHPFMVKTNSIGMRSDRDYPITKPRGRRRLSLLGDSYAMGWGVDNNEAFSELLEAKYPNLDVLNFAQAGSGVDVQLLIYENIAKPFEVDAYIFAPCTLDITRNILQFMPSFSKNQIVYSPRPYFTLNGDNLILHNVPVPKMDTLSEQEAAKRPEALVDLETSPYTNRIGMMLPRSIKQSRLYDRISLALRRPYRGYNSETTEQWRLMRALIKRFVQQVEGKFIFLMPLPTYHHLDMNHQVNYLKRFEEFHNPEKNCFVIDVLPYFKRLPPDERRRCRLENDPLHHYSPMAHQVIAGAVSDSLAQHYPDLIT